MDGQACMDQTNARLIEVGTELNSLRAEQDASTANVTIITGDVADFKAEQRTINTANAQHIQQQVFQQQTEIATLQSHLAQLDINSLLLTQGLIVDEKIKSAMNVVEFNASAGTKDHTQNNWQKQFWTAKQSQIYPKSLMPTRHIQRLESEFQKCILTNSTQLQKSIGLFGSFK